MKLLKYFLFFIVLSTIALIVFILTQNPHFKVERSFIVDGPKNKVYEHINDITHWKDWIETQQVDQNKIEITLAPIGNFIIQPEYRYPTDSLTQDVINDRLISNFHWQFKDQGSKTVIKVRFEGYLDLKTKILTFFSGSPNEVVGKAFDKHLNTLRVFYIKQFTEYLVTPLPMEHTKEHYYIAKKAMVSLKTLDSDIEALTKELSEFCRLNQITLEDTPFLLTSELPEEGRFEVTFASPIKEQIFLNSDDEYFTNTLLGKYNLNTKLTGHYSFLNETMGEAKTLLKNKALTALPNVPYILYLTKSSADTHYPATWETILSIAVEDPEAMVTPQRSFVEPPVSPYLRLHETDGAKSNDSITTVLP